MNVVTIVLGGALFLAPFVFGFRATTLALLTCLLMSAVISLLGYFKEYKWAAVAGLITFVAPWVLGFSGISAAMWSCVLPGGAVAILDGYTGFFSAEAKSSRAQHHLAA